MLFIISTNNKKHMKIRGNNNETDSATLFHMFTGPCDATVCRRLEAVECSVCQTLKTEKKKLIKVENLKILQS